MTDPIRPPRPSAPDLSAIARRWALWLTRQPSVTGTEGERALAHALLARAAARPALAGAEAWSIPAGDGGLACAALLVRGEGAETVLLTGHFDTVGVDDYGDLAPLATDPDALRPALLARLADAATPAELRARADLSGPDFLPGRGLLDMKAGLAAGLAALESFAADPARRGNLLFVAVPDEEATSLGARALADALPGLAAARGIDVVAAINLDAIADDGDGSAGRAAALGSVGKLLLTAFVAGEPSHACYPFAGLNAAALAGAIAAALEWTPALADGSAAPPPALLSLKDGKTGYDVTTPATAFATWNVLSASRPPAATLATFRAAVEAAVAAHAAALGARRAAMGDAAPPPTIVVLGTETLLAEAADRPGGAEALDALGRALAAQGATLPDQCAALTARAWALSGRRGPAVALGVGALPYPAVRLSEAPRARRLRQAIDAARARHPGPPVGVTPVFPGISDMSFLGEAGYADLGPVAAACPAWTHGVGWSGRVGGVPVANLGPWGRDYHTPLERLHAPYAFESLPLLILDVARAALAPG
jgi:arginine utilization protein RocB